MTSAPASLLPKSGRDSDVSRRALRPTSPSSTRTGRIVAPDLKSKARCPWEGVALTGCV
ncbi:MAG: hypothetical protein ACLUEQ_06550 [Cloacibacillus evryensis]